MPNIPGKTVILLQNFATTYPNLRMEITEWMLTNPGESELKDFLFELLAELQRKGAK